MTAIDPVLERKLTQLVREAGAELMQYWPAALRRSREELQITRKSDGSFVTAADLISNRILTTALSALFPADGILSEESPLDPQLPEKERVWVIDPLDGTQTFIDGNDDFAVLLALCNRGALDFGMIYLPAREQMAVAAKGRGATLNGSRMNVSTSTQIRKHGLYLRHFKAPQSDIIFPRWLDSSRAYLRLCQGQFDGVILKIVNHQEWDLAAAAVLIEESGGLVTDQRGGKISFGHGRVEFTHFVASNGRVHSELLKMVGAS